MWALQLCTTSHGHIEMKVWLVYSWIRVSVCFDMALLNNVNVQCVLLAENKRGEKGPRRRVKKQLNGSVCVCVCDILTFSGWWKKGRRIEIDMEWQGEERSRERQCLWLWKHKVITIVVKTLQATHSLFVCEKDRVILAKSSLFSNVSSFALVQKLLSLRSSGPI